jgi:hypothetical protein
MGLSPERNKKANPPRIFLEPTLQAKASPLSLSGHHFPAVLVRRNAGENEGTKLELKVEIPVISQRNKPSYGMITPWI